MIDPEKLGRFAGLVGQFNNLLDRAEGFKVELPGDSVLVVSDGEGNYVRVWTDGSRFRVTEVS